MRWLKENWLDLFIFLLIALVAAGIVLYLTGINPFSRPASQAVAPSPAPSPSAAPTPPPSPTPPSTPAEPVVTVIPLPKAPEAPAAPQATPKATRGREEGAKPAPSPAPTPTASGAYRVVVGAFANPENALRLERELKAKGYLARLEAAGNLTRVVVGPYATEGEAARVARALASYGAQVYRGQGAAPPEGQVYLQVGAFQKEENALALAGKLKEVGLPVVLVKNGVYRVRVGPVAEGEKEAVKAKVEALGLTALEVQ
ncbi:sporulation protein [Thermus sp. 2.9]|uniref:SPOR domain-containing protein n=1 Tax=Thermus sp. (strain 2.9) TaxID=1577051 RepID=UPI000541B38B|nr:SPOR domain-containing protein [Thermus sp. 2.9]KHG65376.1 sporulation protein [Thermus sp. 2.9]